jgi:hypothetical protein
VVELLVGCDVQVALLIRGMVVEIRVDELIRWSLKNSQCLENQRLYISVLVRDMGNEFALEFRVSLSLDRGRGPDPESGSCSNPVQDLYCFLYLHVSRA